MVSFIHSFLFSKRFILVRICIDLKPIQSIGRHHGGTPRGQLIIGNPNTTVSVEPRGKHMDMVRACETVL